MDRGVLGRRVVRAPSTLGMCIANHLACGVRGCIERGQPDFLLALRGVACRRLCATAPLNVLQGSPRSIQDGRWAR